MGLMISGAHQVDVNEASKACTQNLLVLEKQLLLKNQSSTSSMQKVGISMYKYFQSYFLFWGVVKHATFQLPSGLNTEID